MGEFTFFRFSVNCTGQDMELVHTKTAGAAAADPITGGGGGGGGGGGSGAGTEVEMAIRFGSLPTLDDGGRAYTPPFPISTRAVSVTKTLRPPIIYRKKRSHQVEKWSRVRPWPAGFWTAW